MYVSVCSSALRIDVFYVCTFLIKSFQWGMFADTQKYNGWNCFRISSLSDSLAVFLTEIIYTLYINSCVFYVVPYGLGSIALAGYLF